MGIHEDRTIVSHIFGRLEELDGRIINRGIGNRCTIFRSWVKENSISLLIKWENVAGSHFNVINFDGYWHRAVRKYWVNNFEDID